MFKKRGKRWLSLAMSLIMCCAVLPAVARAEGESDESKEPAKLVYDITFEETEQTGNMNFGDNGNEKKRGQTFVAVKGGKVKSIEVSIGRLAETDGDVKASIYSCDETGKGPTGDALGEVTLTKEEVVEFDFNSGKGLGHVTIPLTTDNLEAGKMYMVVLEQNGTQGGYRWSASCDISNSNWWHDDVWNPQVNQTGYEGELPSFKCTPNDEWVDESRCGDYWLKVNYSQLYSYDITFDEVEKQTGSMNFGESGDQYMRGQTFEAVHGGGVKEIEVSIGRTTGAKGSVLAELYKFDSDKNEPVGERLAIGTCEMDKIEEFSKETETGLGHVTIPLSYEGLEKGQMYIVKLGQEGEATSDGFRWSTSNEASNPNWWHDDVWNPQVTQAGHGDNLPSLKFGGDGQITDESRCGDYWLKVFYESEYDLSENTQEPDPDPSVIWDDGPGRNLKERYEEDMEKGGESFYIDRVLSRPNVDPTLIEDSGIMTRGNALYTKGTNSSGLIKEFGFGGVMRYVKGDEPGYAIRVNGQRAEEFIEETSKRADHPSYWCSTYRGKPGSVSEGLIIELRRFITENNVAVTTMDIMNGNNQDKEVDLTVLTDNKFVALDEQTLGGEIYADGQSIQVKLTADGGVVQEGSVKTILTVPAKGSSSYKVQMSFANPELVASGQEYETYKNLSPTEAFTTHVQAYNWWWVENIPYVEVPDQSIQKTIIYRWWIARFNMADMNSRNYPFPTAMEGVFGYNNAIINALPWQLDEMRYLRSPLASYGTWMTAALQANGGIYVDNRAGLWSETPQHYISQAGWETYKVHGGQTEFLKAMADAGAGDVVGTQNKYDSDKNYLFDIQYDAWDADTVSLAYPDEEHPGNRHYSAAQERIDTAAFAWMNAQAVSEMYRQAGDNEQADSYEMYAKQVQEALLANNWDEGSKQFLMKFKGEETFNPLRDINNYYVFMSGMVPQGQEYDTALRVWGDETEFPLWPMYISNSKDFEIAKDLNLNERSRNYSPGSMAITLKMFGSAIKNYDADNITGAEYLNLLQNYTKMSYAGGNSNYPDANEFFSGNGSDGDYRSWIHHNWHSQYNALVLEDVIGLTPREDSVIELNPIDVGWDTFKAENIRYHEQDMTVEWKEGAGYSLSVDGTVVAIIDKLAHFTWDAETGEVAILDESGAMVISNTSASLKRASDISYTEGRVAEIINAAATYKPGDTIIEDDDYPYQAGEMPEHEGQYVIYAPDWDGNAVLGFGNYGKQGDEFQRSQEFAALTNGTLNGVQVMIRNAGASKDVTVEIYTAGEDGLPGKSIAQTTISKDLVRSDKMTKVNVPLTCELEGGKTYYVVLGQQEGGSGAYDWIISSKHIGNLQTIVQGVQAGYEGDLKQVKIMQNSTRVDESQIGDHYLKVYYTPSEVIEVPEKNELKEAIKDAEAINRDEYTKESVQALDDALKAAVVVMENAEATEAEIAEAVSNLRAAIEGLKKQLGTGEDDNKEEKPGSDRENGKGVSEAKKTSSDVKTGDANSVKYLLLLMIVCAVSIGGVIVIRRRKRNR
ncbi:hypothetical protein M2148_001587 [Lachnospiraceae bacterium PF1-4]